MSGGTGRTSATAKRAAVRIATEMYEQERLAGEAPAMTAWRSLERFLHLHPPASMDRPIARVDARTLMRSAEVWPYADLRITC